MPTTQWKLSCIDLYNPSYICITGSTFSSVKLYFHNSFLVFTAYSVKTATLSYIQLSIYKTDTLTGRQITYRQADRWMKGKTERHTDKSKADCYVQCADACLCLYIWMCACTHTHTHTHVHTHTSAGREDEALKRSLEKYQSKSLRLRLFKHKSCEYFFISLYHERHSSIFFCTTCHSVCLCSMLFLLKYLKLNYYYLWLQITCYLCYPDRNI